MSGTEADWLEALRFARRQHQAGAGTVLDVLLRQTGASPARLDEALRAHAGVGVVVEESQFEADYSVLDRQHAQSLMCVPLRHLGGLPGLVMMADPWDTERVQRLCQLLGHVPVLAAAPGASLARWLDVAVPAGPATLRARDLAKPAGSQAGESVVVEFVNAAMQAAFDRGASDVHFECDRHGVAVKLRLDGVMVRWAVLEDFNRAQEVVSRIKVLAQLDITERRIPQDGRFRCRLAAGEVDMRVSIMPSVFGEDAVLRLLDKAQLRSRSDVATLDRLGFDADCAQRMRELAELPHGMLLVTGPTGSGKTTTVYALLSEINTGMEKIITIEDPVEYELAGVLQIPVNERKGLTFAKGLRSILRHDPDRILVGEIRDAETAEIAVQSALTGHQVFTTVHANSVFDVTGRFRHFGLDMFGFMSALNGLVVQRLVRTLCVDCRGWRKPAEREQRWLGGLGLEGPQVPEARGCDRCHSTGYRGRMVLAEVHRIDDGFRDLVTGGASLSSLREHVLRVGGETLASQAARRVLAGMTTTEEIRRVVGW